MCRLGFSCCEKRCNVAWMSYFFHANLFITSLAYAFVFLETFFLVTFICSNVSCEIYNFSKAIKIWRDVEELCLIKAMGVGFCLQFIKTLPLNVDVFICLWSKLGSTSAKNKEHQVRTRTHSSYDKHKWKGSVNNASIVFGLEKFSSFVA